MTFPNTPSRALLLLAVVAGGLVPRPVRAAVEITDRNLPIDIRLSSDEADAALAILDEGARGEPIGAAAWKRLFESTGYRRLEARQESMGRELDAARMRAYLESDSMRARAGAMRETVEAWKKVQMLAAARRAFTYLPQGTRIEATVYFVIKPQTNSFVYDLHGDPAIFLYVDPAIPPARLANTIAHELHHVGYARACAAADADTAGPPEERMIRTWAGAFGEGVAVLAAAGGPLVHPDLTWSKADQAAWKRDMIDGKFAMARLERFFTSIADGSLSDPDSITARGMTFFGDRGPWYTIGWQMADAVERAFGRDHLIDTLCDMRQLVIAYQAAVPVLDARYGAELPRWSGRMLAAMRGEPLPPE